MPGPGRLIRLGLMSLVAAGPTVAGAAPPPGQVVIASIDLADVFGTRSAWQFVAFQDSSIDDPLDPSGDKAPGVVTLCLRKEASGPCDPQLQGALRAASGDDPYSEPHYLDEAHVVHSREVTGRSLLLVRTASLHGSDGDQLVLTQVLAYQRDADRFVRVYAHSTGTNNDQEVRYVEAGPLAGDIVSVEPTRDVPFGFWVSVNAPSGQAYTERLRYRSATRYGDNNPLPVIDSEMPNIQQRLGIWHSGLPLPLPAGSCPRPRLVRTELWCD